LPLIYFKYSFFLHLSSHSLVLPLAISFYTFQQIAFLADVYQKKIKPGTFMEYLFFVIFFPQLVAGPIVHYREIMEQVHAGALERGKEIFVQAGIVLFSLGLFKKVVLADQLFPFADNAFGHVATLNSIDAWTGMFAYSFGIYFDFSGYTDMAIGLALLFGIKLPVNFNSPYRAVDIVDFWRRWHITLSHFLRDYIYIPLGGNRKGEKKEIFNLIVTMTLGGIWHGSGWTFLLWGLLHGVLLSIVHLKNRYFGQWKLPMVFAIPVTFVIVSLLWVLFRAENIAEAWNYYEVLFRFDTAMQEKYTLFWLLAGLGIVWFLPNSMAFIGYRTKLKIGQKHIAIAAIFLFIALKLMAEAPAQRFVYFNF
jgi:D-alanyl-lipoteichoic acid acyltransferase DltB (MBOAT superfamily)